MLCESISLNPGSSTYFDLVDCEAGECNGTISNSDLSTNPDLNKVKDCFDCLEINNLLHRYCCYDNSLYNCIFCGILDNIYTLIPPPNQIQSYDIYSEWWIAQECSVIPSDLCHRPEIVLDFCYGQPSIISFTSFPIFEFQTLLTVNF